MVKEFADHEKTHKLLYDIIPNFDQSYSTAAILETQMMKNKIKKFMPFDHLKDCKIKNSGMKDTGYFKIEFPESLIQFVPHEMFHLRTTIQSRTLRKEDEQYDYPFTHSYIPNINHLTLRVAHNESEIAEETSVNKDFDAYNIFTYDGNTPPSIDTLNDFHKGYSKKQMGISDQKIKDKIRNCFEFCYWNLPDDVLTGRIVNLRERFGFIKTPDNNEKNLYFSMSSVSQKIKIGDEVEFEIGKNSKGPVAVRLKKIYGSSSRSIIHNFVYDRPKSIADIVLVRKTIARIDKIEEGEEKINMVDTNQTRATRATVTFLVDNGVQILPKTQSLYITNNAINGLCNGDVINCIMAKTIHEQKKSLPFSNATIIGCIDKIHNDLRPYIGLASWKKMQAIGTDKTLCRMGAIPHLGEKIMEILKIIDPLTLKSVESRENLNNLLENAIESLFPIFIADDGHLFHNPPTVIAYIACHYPQALQNKDDMLGTALMLDTFANNYEKWGYNAQMKVRTHDYADRMQKDKLSRLDLNALINSFLG